MDMERNPSGTDRSADASRGSDAPPRTDNQTRKEPSKGEPRPEDARAQGSASAHGTAGNAVFDPDEQTTRADMPLDEQASAGEVHRGSLPPRTRADEPSPRAGLAPKDRERPGDGNRP